MTSVTTPSTIWHSLGGQIVGEPSVVARGEYVNVFYRGENNRLYNVGYDGSKWGSHEDLGGIIYDSPAAAAISDTQIEVLVQGGGGALYSKSYKGGKWDNFKGQGGVFVGPPAIATYGDGKTAEAFVINKEGHLWRKTFDGTNWSSQYKRLATGVTGAPSPVRNSSNNIEVYAVGQPDKKLVFKITKKDGSVIPAGEELRSVSGAVNDRPSPVTMGNLMTIFYHSEGGGVSHHEWSSETKHWDSGVHHYGRSVEGPTAVVRKDSYYVYYRGTDGQVYRSIFNGTSWNPALTAWNSIGGNITSRPIPVPGGYKKAWVFARGNDKGLHYYI